MRSQFAEKRIRRERHHPRRGLAPLELVLSLPVLMFMMALMVNISVVASWKVRSLTAARQAIYRDRVGWNGSQDPKPGNFWPDSGTLSTSGANSLTDITPLWEQSPLTHPFARGPVISDMTGNSGGYIQVRNLRYLEMSERVQQGNSTLQRPMPLLPTLGGFSFDQHHELVDSRWQFQSMGFADNRSRRAKGWYNFETGEWNGEAVRFRQADLAIVGNPRREDLVPLDRDPELLAFYGSYIDFYPRPGGCELDPQTVHDSIVLPLIDRIKGRPSPNHVAGVPERMAETFKRMYESQIAALENLDPQPPGAAQMIADLQLLVDQLNSYLATIPQ